ncbi:dihydroorotate dehydrogenase [Pelagibacterium luteolum]|uniref:Dihydroorotate dehydrogenase n=1 Tax=Pelagibacterium luteolum TaxID=440168 RepID=A0A1G7RZF8_9HYPH|nr:dihydroorotate dehydrogenase [Pelagibacterium luteolum]SDG16165.1 dihydroorotate dehydrogenase (NAD+) catalytic subunit [Pelagibacterium luteolum]
MVDLKVDMGRGLVLANPVMPASGTFAEGLAKVVDLNGLGALVTKTITAELRGGNPTPRVAEVGNGMLNSIGIPSKGIDQFLDEALPFYRRFSSPLIVSISAPTVDDFGRAAARLNVEGIAGIEANISCPNIEEDGKAFAMRPQTTEQAVSAMRKVTDLPLWAKLTPNTGDIASVARAAEAAGADGLVVANTILAMTIDIETMRPTLGNVMGGLSGPAVKPIALRMTYQCARAVDIPVIGCGGIASAEDAVEFLLAGARAVQVGTATFTRPGTMDEVIAGITEYCRRKGFNAVAELGAALNADMLAPDVMEAAQ